jgi:general secretion pathway protein A
VAEGIPRVINVSCDRALLGAYTQETRKVTAALVRRAAGEVYGRRFVPSWLAWLAGAAGALMIAGIAIGGWRLASGHVLADVFARHRTNPTPASMAMVPHAGAAESAAMAPSAAATATTPATGTSATGTSATGTQPTAAPAPMPAAAPVSINALLAANSAYTGDAAAFRRLLSLWGTAMSDDKDPCGQAAKAGLSCLEQRGSWAQVRALNRPAILTLTDDHGLLSALDDRAATLDLGERDERVPLDEISRDWFGEFTVVWKPKTPRTRPLSLGMKGDEVRWLRRSLNALHGGASDPEHADVYDEELAIAVQNFQREHRLNVDGVAGVQTQVMLDTALAEPGSPLLLPTTRGS